MDPSWLPSFERLDDPSPHARLLSNGRSSVLLTSAGTGFSAWHDTLLSAWEGDRTEDGDGWFVYLRDLDGGAFWSAAHQPVPGAPDQCAARYTAGCVTLERRVAEIESSLSVCVSPDADVEVRRLTLTNRSARPRRIEVTSYLEVVLNGRAAHAAHPAFSKLFVETELDASSGTLLARRRPRNHDETPPWMAAALLGAGGLEHETDRARFGGRNRPQSAPQALAEAAALRWHRARPSSSICSSPAEPTARRRWRRWRVPPQRMPWLPCSSARRPMSASWMRSWASTRARPKPIRSSPARCCTATRHCVRTKTRSRGRGAQRRSSGSTPSAARRSQWCAPRALQTCRASRSC